MVKKGKKSSSEKKGSRREAKAGLVLPVSMIDGKFRGGLNKKRLTAMTPIFATGALEFAVTQLLQAAEELRVADKKYKSIQLVYIGQALGSDKFRLKGIYPAVIGGINVPVEDSDSDE